MKDPRIDRALVWIVKRQFWVEVGVLTLLTVICALYIGRLAYSSATALETQARTLESTRRGADLWITGFQPVSTAEMAAWEKGLQTTYRLGVLPTERLTLAQIVTARAERAGLKQVRVSFSPSDPATASPRPEAAPYTFAVAPYTIKVEFTGRLDATQTFMGMLPPSVGLVSLESARTSGTFGTKLLLTVYEVATSAAK